MVERMGDNRSRSSSSGGMVPEDGREKAPGNASPGPRRLDWRFAGVATRGSGVCLWCHVCREAATGAKHQRAPVIRVSPTVPMV
ncbi:hypothetical protein R1flu_012248 [Riccia fluitans]|uniref:Uncharacterized protein n=1 Tax=Riccia fluitans TaxID=41844 RepID=A0ABD1ZA34_9MARC